MANLILGERSFTVRFRIQGKKKQKIHFPNASMNIEKVQCYIMTWAPKNTKWVLLEFVTQIDTIKDNESTKCKSSFKIDLKGLY